MSFIILKFCLIHWLKIDYNCRALRFSEAAGLTPFDVFFDGEGYHINTPLNTLLGDYNITVTFS